MNDQSKQMHARGLDFEPLSDIARAPLGTVMRNPVLLRHSFNLRIISSIPSSSHTFLPMVRYAWVPSVRQVCINSISTWPEVKHHFARPLSPSGG